MSTTINPSTLKDVAVGFEETDIRHEYSQQELDTIRELFTDESLRRADKEEKFAEIRRAHKAEMTLIIDSIKTLAIDIRNRYKDTKARCGLVPNFETGMMQYYDENTGELVHTRRLRPDERQTTMMNVIRSNADAKAA